MLPWIEAHTIPLGSITIQVWGLFVAFGFLVGAWIASRRARFVGISSKDVWDLVFWIFLASLIGARLFHVVFYAFSFYTAHPFEIINLFAPGFSIVGGLIGSVFAFLLFIRRKKLSAWKLADACAYALPFGLALGRIGCALIHDHPGTVCRRFFLCVVYPDGVPRHDHGLYLSLLGLVIAILFLFLGRIPRREGFFVGLWMVFYGFARFILDFFRIGDTVFFFLTPAQWLMIPLFIGGIFILMRTYRLTF